MQQEELELEESNSFIFNAIVLVCGKVHSNIFAVANRLTAFIYI